jgi:alkylhydroperoxidase family enzyme
VEGSAVLNDILLFKGGATVRRIPIWTLGITFAIGVGAVPAQKQEQPRVPYVSEHPDDPELAKNFDEFRARLGYVSNVVLITSNAPGVNKAIGDFARGLRAAPKVPKQYTDLSILRITQLESGTYQYFHELPSARACGISQAQIDALPGWRKSSAFDPKQRAVLAFAEGVIEKSGPDDETFKTLSAFFAPGEIVELTVTDGFYVMQSLYGKALRIPVEQNFDSGKTNPSC